MRSAALAFYRDRARLEWEGELPLPGGRMYHSGVWKPPSSNC